MNRPRKRVVSAEKGKLTRSGEKIRMLNKPTEGALVKQKNLTVSGG